eukprot:scaffold8028_cov81-Cylindrotheca_fusiformis.AAC.3
MTLLSRIGSASISWLIVVMQQKFEYPRGALTLLRVDSSVTWIPVYAFKGCESLVQVRLPTTLTWIGDSAFHNCSNLKTVFSSFQRNASFDTSAIKDSQEDGVIKFAAEAVFQVGDSALESCQSLPKVIVCSVSTELNRLAFQKCSGLISVQLPEGLRVIEESLFADCGSLTVPSSVIKIRLFQGKRKTWLIRLISCKLRSSAG